MVFNNNKSFFLTLDGEAAPAKIVLPKEEIETEESHQDTPHEPSAPTLLVAPSDQSGAAPSAPAPVSAAVSTPVAAAVTNDVPAVQSNQNATAEASEPKTGGITTAEAMAV